MTTEDVRSGAPKVSVLTLAGMVVGSIVGGGVFTLPQNFGAATGVLGAVIAWVIAGTGMLMLAFVFQSLAVRRPDLDNGIYVYAQAGFGNCRIQRRLGLLGQQRRGQRLLPDLRDGQHRRLPAGTWSGQHGAGRASLFEEVKATMLITTFVFLGVEGASAYSRLARRREDIGRATVLGFVSTLALFASVALVSYGILPQSRLAHAEQPSMGVVLRSAVGEWGGTMIDVAVIVSVLGAYLAWTLLNAEVMFDPARTEIMPRALARENSNGTPIAALVTTSVSVQLFLLLVLVIDNALDFMLKLDTALALVPYLLVAAYAFKLTVTGQTYDGATTERRRRDQVVAALAIVYAVFLLYSAGSRYLLLSCLIYAPGTLLYLRARRERGKTTLTAPELGVCILLWTLAVLAAVLLATGALKL
ncbi:amino acid permease [Aeromicrobium wangtongii]|uniref:Amino acid permease n=1 Tax=Aeromicrobium wangtongii TaxID=2969247 RepID=A0ABY5M1M8_9ACTN|nr:amino acid permease [Aeromicrobium wangtongii]MCD9198080.1 amino acid permease [Aeromicrobium wangtongii]UUP12120.1 amino acid permease [Aeromicrobium wangtongii]